MKISSKQEQKTLQASDRAIRGTQPWLGGLLRGGHPKYWLLGGILMFFRLLAYFPHSVLRSLGSGLGTALALLPSRPRAICEANVALCFPQLTGHEQQLFVRKCFRELGISIAETLKVWFSDVEPLYEKHVDIEGEEHWQQALASGRGIILVSCHYGSLDLNAAFAGYLARKHRRFAFTYRKPSDDTVNGFLVATRAQYGDHFFPVNNLVGIVRTLKNRGVVWYAPDIEVKNKNTVFADFMGVPASTTVALSRIAEASNAIVVPVAHYRKLNANKGYILKVLPMLDNFPSGNVLADTRLLNQQIEQMIEPFPERYWWVIKRFKNRQQGEAPVY